MFIWIFIFSLQSIHLHIFLIMTIRVDLICSYLHLLSLCFFLSVFFFSLEQKQICLNVHHHTQTPRATCTTRVSRSVKPKPSIWFEFYLYIFYPTIHSHFLLIWKWSFLPFHLPTEWFLPMFSLGRFFCYNFFLVQLVFRAATDRKQNNDQWVPRANIIPFYLSTHLPLHTDTWSLLPFSLLSLYLEDCDT